MESKSQEQQDHFVPKSLEKTSQKVEISLETAPELLSEIISNPEGKETLFWLFLREKGENPEPARRRANELSSEQIIEKVLRLLEEEKNQMEAVQKSAEPVFEDAHQDLKGIHEFQWPEEAKIRLVGQKWYCFYNLIENFRLNKPLKEVSSVCKGGGEYFPGIDQAVVLYLPNRPESEYENRPWEEHLYHTAVHEGIHQLGGSIHEKGKLIDRGLGGMSGENYSSVLEEGFVEWLTIKIEVKQGREPFNRYAEAVNLFEHFRKLLGDSFVDRVIVTHRDSGEQKDLLRQELDHTFGDGFFDIYSNLQHEGPLIKDWSNMNKEEIRSFMNIINQGELPTIFLEPINREKIKKSIKYYFWTIAGQAINAFLHNHPREELEKLLTKLPDGIRIPIEKNLNAGWSTEHHVEQVIENYLSGIKW